MMKKQQILIVDDEIPIGRYVKKSLEQNEEFFEVTHYSNPLKALKAVKEKTFDLLIIDLMMPEMDGFDLSAEFRKLPSYKKTPIVIYSSMTRQEDRIKAMSAPIFAEGYISKDDDSIDFLTHQIRSIFWRKEASLMNEQVDFARKLGESIGHEASQSLLAISGYQEIIKIALAKENYDKKKIIEYLEKIGISINELKSIIDYLKNLNDIEIKDIGAGDLIIKVKE